MKIIKLICSSLVCFMILCSVDCRKKTSSECHHIITITNNSNNTLYCNYSELYPDTSVDCNSYNLVIGPNDNFELKENTSCFEDQFDKFINIQFFFIDSVVYENASCDSVKAYGLYLKRTQVNIDQMNNRGWNIVYP